MVSIYIQIRWVRVTYVKYLMRYAKEVHRTRDSNVRRISKSTASLERVNNRIVREWSGIGSVRTIERVLWRNGVNNGQTDWGVKINYMGDVAYRSSLTDVRSNIFITIQIPATLVAAWKQVNKLCRRHSEEKQMESQLIFSENQTIDLSEIYIFSLLPSTPTCIFSSNSFFLVFSVSLFVLKHVSCSVKFCTWPLVCPVR